MKYFKYIANNITDIHLSNHKFNALYFASFVSDRF